MWVLDAVTACSKHDHNNTTKTTATYLSCSSCSWRGYCLMVCHRHAHNNTTKTTAANLSCSSCSWKGHCLVVCHLLWNPCCAYTNAQATAARFSSYVTSCFLIWCVLLCQRWREERLPAQRPLRCSDAWGEYYSFPWLDLLVHRLCGMGIYAVATMLAAPALPYQHAAHLPSNQNAVDNSLHCHISTLPTFHLINLRLTILNTAISTRCPPSI